MAWKIDSEDTESPEIRAIKLYQDLLNFHKNRENQDAFIEADLLRLLYGYNKSYGDEKNARYKAALKHFTQKWADHEMSARATYRHADPCGAKVSLWKPIKWLSVGSQFFLQA